MPLPPQPDIIVVPLLQSLAWIRNVLVDANSQEPSVAIERITSSTDSSTRVARVSDHLGLELILTGFDNRYGLLDLGLFPQPTTRRLGRYVIRPIRWSLFAGLFMSLRLALGNHRRESMLAAKSALAGIGGHRSESRNMRSHPFQNCST
jgi:hypothetical protein